MAVALLPTIAASLLECLCNAVNAAPNPPAQCCYRVAGDVTQDADMFTDMCCEGLAYVSVGDRWASSDSFPAEDSTRQAIAKCPPVSWGLSLKFGIIRCAPTMGATENEMPTCEQWTAAATQQFYDSDTLAAAACCFRNAYPNLDPELLGFYPIIGRQVSATPQGGCIERSQTVMVQIPTGCECF